MAGVVDPAVPHYVYLNIRLREEYRPMLTYLCHYGDIYEMFLIGGLVADGETLVTSLTLKRRLKGLI